MNNLNEQIERATAIIDEVFGYGITEEDVSSTNDTVQMWIDQWGAPDDTREGDGWHGYEWNKLQARKGEPRFNLIIVDFGGEYRFITQM